MDAKEATGGEKFCLACGGGHLRKGVAYEATWATKIQPWAE